MQPSNHSPDTLPSASTAHNTRSAAAVTYAYDTATPLTLQRQLLLVGAGAIIGVLLRYGITVLTQAVFSGGPAATNSVVDTVSLLTINIAGSLALGALTGVAVRRALPKTKLLVGTGMCGSFTSYSAFAVLATGQLNSALFTQFLCNIAATALLCPLAALAGLLLGSRLPAAKLVAAEQQQEVAQ